MTDKKNNKDRKIDKKRSGYTVKKKQNKSPSKRISNKKNSFNKSSVKQRGTRRTKRKTSLRRKTGKKSKISLLVVLLLLIILLLVSFILYTIVIFPKTLNKNIKNDLIVLYNPKSYEDAQNIFILSLSAKPLFIKQKEVFEKIRDNYGLTIKFEKIKNIGNNGINRLKFYKGNNEYKEICPIYIYWHENIEIIKSRDDIKEIIKYEKTDANLNIKKQDILKSPDVSNFKYCKTSNIQQANNKVKIVIVIDDVGYSYDTTYDFLSIGIPLTFGIIPDLQNSKKFYNLFNKYGYKTILHIPMEPLKGSKYVEKNALKTNMSDMDLKYKIQNFLNNYPDVIGANNHMGSKAITDARLMNILIGELKNNDKIWLDSRTTIGSCSKEIASIYNMKNYERDVFLDNNKDRASIKKAMELLINEAKKKGYAIGIGHVQSKELVYILKEYYNKKDMLGIEFVTLDMLDK